MSSEVKDLTDQVVAPHLATVSDALDVLQQEGLWRLDDDQTLAAAQAAYAVAERAHAAAVELLGQLDARGLAPRVGAASTQAWLTATSRVRTAAKRDVTVARLLHAAAGAESAGQAENEGAVEGAIMRAGMHSGAVNGEQAGAI
ncbi:MAG: hypothetical protein ACRDP4_13110, partial [Nocardioidaceae bacterium]